MDSSRNVRPRMTPFGLAPAVVPQAPPPMVPQLYCLSHVANRRDASVRRGAKVKALAICSPYRFLHVWKPVLLLAMDRMFELCTGRFE